MTDELTEIFSSLHRISVEMGEKGGTVEDMMDVYRKNQLDDIDAAAFRFQSVHQMLTSRPDLFLYKNGRWFDSKVVQENIVKKQEQEEEKRAPDKLHDEVLCNMHTVALTNGERGTNVFALMKDYNDLYGDLRCLPADVERMMLSRPDLFCYKKGKWFGKSTDQTARVHGEIVRGSAEEWRRMGERVEKLAGDKHNEEILSNLHTVASFNSDRGASVFALMENYNGFYGDLQCGADDLENMMASRTDLFFYENGKWFGKCTDETPGVHGEIVKAAEVWRRMRDEMERTVTNYPFPPELTADCGGRVEPSLLNCPGGNPAFPAEQTASPGKDEENEVETFLFSRPPVGQAATTLPKLVENVHTVLCCNVKTGSTVAQILRDYQNLYGPLDLYKFGFSTLGEVMTAFPERFCLDGRVWRPVITDAVRPVVNEILNEKKRREEEEETGVLSYCPFDLKDGDLVAQMLDLMNPHLEGMTEAEIILAYNRQYGDLDLPTRSLREFFGQHTDKFRSLGVYRWSSIPYPTFGGGFWKNEEKEEEEEEEWTGPPGLVDRYGDPPGMKKSSHPAYPFPPKQTVTREGNVNSTDILPLFDVLDQLHTTALTSDTGATCDQLLFDYKELYGPLFLDDYGVWNLETLLCGYPEMFEFRNGKWFGVTPNVEMFHNEDDMASERHHSWSTSPEASESNSRVTAATSSALHSGRKDTGGRVFGFGGLLTAPSHSRNVEQDSLDFPGSAFSRSRDAKKRSLAVPVSASSNSCSRNVDRRHLAHATEFSRTRDRYEELRTLSTALLSAPSHSRDAKERSLADLSVSASSGSPDAEERSLTAPTVSASSPSPPDVSDDISDSEVDALLNNYLFDLKLSPSVDYLKVRSSGSVNTVTLTAVGAPIVFKVKCSSNRLYRISPVYHSMNPGTHDLEITRLDGEPSRDVLVVQYAMNTAGPDVSARDAWKDLKGKKEFVIKIKAVEEDEDKESSLEL